MLNFIISVIQYLVIAGLIVETRHNPLPGKIWLIAIAIIFVLNLLKTNKNYYIKGYFIIDIFASCAMIFFLPSLKARIILMILSCIIIGIGSNELKNGDINNNETSTEFIIGGTITFHAFLNIYYCFKPGTGSRFWNIVFVIVAMFIAGSKIDRVKGVQEYDKQQKELDEEKRKSKDNYERSDFYKATKIPYYTMISDSGIHAEYSTSTWLYNIKNEYKALFSVSIPVDDELGSTEIDIIVICAAGIYALEVKNRKLKWLIDGTDKNAYCFDQYGQKQIVHNPVVQNENHIKALKYFIQKKGDSSVKKAFGILNNRIDGYIVFAWNTIDWDITNYDRGYCSYKNIGKMIQSSIDDFWIQDDDEHIWAINTIYNFLKKYENNQELRSKHDTMLKIRNWKENL